MKKIIIYIFAIIFPFVFVVNVSSAYEEPFNFTRDKIIIKKGAEEKRYDVELAITGREQEHGLMYRKELAKDSGMLFIIDPEREMKMWMKNTYIPLDMLFIDKYGKIAYIEENTEPNSEKVISPGVKVKAVLEVAGGTAKRENIIIGDRIIYKAFEK